MTSTNTLIQVRHTTRFVYQAPLRYSIQRLYLTPRSDQGCQVRHWQIEANGELTHQRDAFGNWVSSLVSYGPTEMVEIRVHGEVLQRVEKAPGTAPVQDDQGPPLAVYLRTTPLTQPNESLLEFAAQHVGGSGHGPARSAEQLLQLGQAIQQRVQYTPGATHVHTTAADAWNHARGVCQDHAHVMLAACRGLGIPARYVSGYLAGESSAAQATHAWTEVWSHHGWFPVDVTHGCAAEGRWLRLAVGLDYAGVSPTRGVRQGGGDEILKTEVMVQHQAVK